MRGAWKLTLSNGQTPHGLFTLIFRKSQMDGRLFTIIPPEDEYRRPTGSLFDPHDTTRYVIALTLALDICGATHLGGCELLLVAAGIIGVGAMSVCATRCLLDARCRENKNGIVVLAQCTIEFIFRPRCNSAFLVKLCGCKSPTDVFFHRFHINLNAQRS